MIEWQLDETLDINGWDLQKALRLLYKSNPILFECAVPPLSMRSIRCLRNFGRCQSTVFLSRHGVYHYLSTAHSNYRKYLWGRIGAAEKVFRCFTSAACLLLDYSDEDIAAHVFSELMERKQRDPETKRCARISDRGGDGEADGVCAGAAKHLVPQLGGA